jgi:hypothetical protein
VIGPAGRRDLLTGAVEGVDPLAGHGDHAAAVLATATGMARAPELYVNSLLEPGTLEVAAFEPLVGCHGGLGGWQDRGFLLAPRELPPPALPLLGGEQLHAYLVGALTALGHRTGLTRSTA